MSTRADNSHTLMQNTFSPSEISIFKIQNVCDKIIEYQFYNVFLHVEMYIHVFGAQGKQNVYFRTVDV